MFGNPIKQSGMIADLYDTVTAFAYTFAKVYGGKGQKPKPYPRPIESDDDNKFGKDPIPISEFNDWYYGGD